LTGGPGGHGSGTSSGRTRRVCRRFCGRRRGGGLGRTTAGIILSTASLASRWSVAAISSILASASSTTIPAIGSIASVPAIVSIASVPAIASVASVPFPLPPPVVLCGSCSWWRGSRWGSRWGRGWWSRRGSLMTSKLSQVRMEFLHIGSNMLGYGPAEQQRLPTQV